MPELPEVETTCRGITPYLINENISEIVVRNRNLRWPVSSHLVQQVKGQTITNVSRRGKYILIQTGAGCIILHLGMSGSIRVLTSKSDPLKHDHIDLILMSGTILRFNDPRRFGSLHWTRKNPQQHKLLKDLGPEPFDESFNVDYLYSTSRKRKQSIKTFIMDSKIVVGVGNIYANESLFLAGIHPKRKAGNISKQRYRILIDTIKIILQNAIDQGGTTLRDFVNSEGKPGYFAQQLNVYNRNGQKCKQCDAPIVSTIIGQRSTFYCNHCQQ